MKILLDTNFLIYLAKYRLFDALKELNKEIIVLENVEKELKMLAAKRKDKENASLALEIIKKWDLNIEKSSEKNADNALLKKALKIENSAVATMDKELIERLKARGIKVLKIRQKKKLVLD